MKTLFLDCGMGAAGDMLTAALMDLLPEEEQQEFLQQLENLQIPGVKYELTDAEKCGIHGKHMKVTVHGEEEISEDVSVHEHVTHDHHDHDHHDHDHHNHDHHDHDHHDHDHHDHDHHDHHHSHAHHSVQDIQEVVEKLPVSDKVKKDVVGVYRLIAEAESKAHNKDITQIHFHEVGNMDAVADVTAVCMLMEKLALENIVASPIHVGSGHVKCAHGILPVPAPATAYILQNVPTYGGEIQGELCTPTGAALLKYFVKRFGNMPVMATDRIGYGMGYKDFKFANCVRVSLGEEFEQTGSLSQEQKRDELPVTEYICELSCNLDDMTGEEIGFAMEVLLDAGALDVYTQSIGMKKNRPGIKLNVLCKEADSEKYAELLLKYTTTLGVREARFKRYTLERKENVIETPLGNVREKISFGYGVEKKKTEFEDRKKIAMERGLTLREVEEVCVVQKSNLW